MGLTVAIDILALYLGRHYTFIVGRWEYFNQLDEVISVADDELHIVQLAIAKY